MGEAHGINSFNVKSPERAKSYLNLIMRKLKILTLILLPFLFSAQKIRVFVVAGQSNMNGFGYTKDLPKELKEF